MTAVLIRDLTPEDYPTVAQLIIAASMPYWKEQDYPESVIQELTNKYDKHHLVSKSTGNPFFIAVDTSFNKVVGVIGLRKNDDNSTYNRLSTFFIHPEYQGQGIGRLLFERVMNEAIERGCTRLYVSSSPKAEKIYEHFGFKKIRVDWKEYENGLRDYNIWMEKQL